MRTLKGQLNSSFARSSRPGSALILVVVLTVLLSVVGVMFMMVSRIGEMSSSSMGDTMALDTGVDIIVSRIEEVLVDDIVGVDGFLLNNDNSDEYWDYPGPDDPWLASLEPIYDGTNYIWPHVTDLYSDNFGLGFAPPRYYDPQNDSDLTQADSTNANSVPFEVAPRVDPINPANSVIPSNNVIAKILHPDTRVHVIEDGYDILAAADENHRWYAGARADADGDGVADSRWFVVPHVAGSEGEDLYAAVRIIDNSGMININTAYRDPTNLLTTPGQWDGSLLSHVNLQGIISDTDNTDGLDATTIQDIRFGGNNVFGINNIPTLPIPAYLDYQNYANDIQYETDVAGRLLNPASVYEAVNNPIGFYHYLPFDLSDELDLRNRFFLSSPADTRCSLAWPVTFKPGNGSVGKTQLYYPGDELDNWYAKLKPDVDHPFLAASYIDTPNLPIGFYNRRFFSTTLNLDRTIAPWVDINSISDVMPGELSGAWNAWTDWDQTADQWTYRPVCINDVIDPNVPDVDVKLLAAAIWLGLPDGSDIKNMPQFTAFGWGDDLARQSLACMMAVNLVDYIDNDSTVTSLKVGNTTYYGHESAADQLYITKIAVAQYDDTDDGVDNGTTNYAVEVYNPSDNPTNLSNWELKINNGAPIAISGNTILARTSGVIASDITTPAGFSTPSSISVPLLIFAVGDTIELILKQASGDVVFDQITIPVDPLAAVPTEFRNHVMSVTPPLEIYYAEREIAESDPYYRLNPNTEATMPIWPETLIWDSTPVATLPDYSTGTITDITNPPIQLEVPDAKLRTIGELTNVLALGMMHNSAANVHYNMPEFFNNILSSGMTLTDPNFMSAGRVDLTKPEFANIFKYLTVFKPFDDGVDNDGNYLYDESEELAIAGRININTAPWFVMAQLPWMQHFITPGDPLIVNWYDRARLIYYDRYTNGAFTNIADIMRVPEMGSLAFDTDQNSNVTSPPTPDFTDDTFTDDLEERDLIFQRISNLVTVRSDLFTAYILVRLDVNGPQKRMIAIFDRSGVFSPGDRPRLIALHQVPDPR